MHVTPYVTDFGGALATLIDGSKDLTERIHAGVGVVDYGVCTFDIGGHHAAAPMPDMTADECCAKIKESLPADGPGMKAVDWKSIWSTIRPYVKLLVAALLG